jgi:pilus assembly protein Flp/PilA
MQSGQPAEAPRSPERGASTVEYSLLVALIAAVIIGVVTLIGQDLPGGFQIVEGAL